MKVVVVLLLLLVNGHWITAAAAGGNAELGTLCTCRLLLLLKLTVRRTRSVQLIVPSLTFLPFLNAQLTLLFQQPTPLKLLR